MKEYEAKEIICPKCNSHIGTYDGRSKINFIGKCKRCKVLIVYNVDSKKIETKPLPKRNCSSGMTFH